MRFWHYTLGITLLQIVKDGRIRRTRQGVEKRERAAVWFTTRETWEPTATKGIISVNGDEAQVRRFATIEEMIEAVGALVRLEVSEHTARHTWADHRRLGQIDPRIADALEVTAKDFGSDPNEWRVCYRDVPVTDILAVDTWNAAQEIWETVGAQRSGKGALTVQAPFARLLKAAAERQRNVRLS